MSRVLHKTAMWLKSLFRRREIDRELDDEIAAHVQLMIDEKVANGMTHEEARRVAKLELGGVEQAKEAIKAVRAGMWVEVFVQDLQFGLRTLRKSPGFAVIAVLTLALGVGANGAVFNLLRAVVFPSLPIPSPDEVFVLHGIRTPNDGAFLYSQPAFERLRQSTEGELDGPRMAAHSAVAEGELVADSGGPVKSVSFQLVSTNFFSVLRVSASAGRLLEPSDNRVSRERWPIVLRYGFWRQYYNSDPHVIGRTQVLNGALVSIVGVAAPGFDGVIPGEAPDFWLPLKAQHNVRYVGPFDSPGNGDHKDLSKPYNQQSALFWLTLIARVRPGEAASSLARWDTAFEPDRKMYEQFDSPEQKLTSGNAHFSLVQAASNDGALSKTYSKPLFLLMGIVGLLLLIACLNLANLQRTRMLRRSHEFAIRSALGSSRLRLLQQIAAEIIPLGACAGLASVAIAYLLGPLLVRMSSSVPIHLNLRFGFEVYLFCSLLLLVALVLFEVLPARKLLFSQAQPAAGLASAHRSVGVKGCDGGDAMLGAQIALCVLLLSLATMFVRTVQKLTGLNMGLDQRQILTVRFDFYNSRFRDAELLAIYPRMMERLRSLPGVRFVVQDMCPPPNCLWNTPVHAAGVSGEIESHQDDVGSGYFRAMGIPLLHGREFDDEDQPASVEVAIVNRTLASRLFGPTQAAVGQRVRFGKSPNHATYLIVGETADVRVDDVRRPPPPMIYLPVAQHFPTRGALEVRTVNGAAAESANVRTALRAVDAQLPLSTITPLDEAYAYTFHTESLLATLISTFGILAVALAAIGIYGVESFRVSRRAREFGVRMVLGASRHDILTMVLSEVLWVAVIGAVSGGVVAIVFSLGLHNLLFEVHDNGLGSWVFSSLILCVASVLAAVVPAQRATCIDPAVALRHE